MCYRYDTFLMEDKFFLEKKKKKVFFGLRAHALLRLAMKIANKDLFSPPACCQRNVFLYLNLSHSFAKMGQYDEISFVVKLGVIWGLLGLNGPNRFARVTRH
jgi:hypothetical protein